MTDDRSHSERLFSAFQQRHIRLRLKGTRLPPDYTISLRLPTMNDCSKQPKKPSRKRRRVDPAKYIDRRTSPVTDSDPESGIPEPDQTEDRNIPEDECAAIASGEDEDTTIRANNAYTGSVNTIGSVHQRHWFLTLDRRRSGFHKARSGSDEGRWLGSWEPFFVLGREYERSVITGRNADEVMEDEGVEKFVGRKMWRPVME